ncbi:hypothetical protein [Janibacter limosus]|uniref:hypothetical protein n=1 Tax=Janibacter limosus TaxID=53458 RepID=UPI0013EEB388|nr:hypothetical protein [Janibacter limosus]
MRNTARVALTGILVVVVVAGLALVHLHDDPPVRHLGASAYDDFEAGTPESHGWTFEQPPQGSVRRSTDEASSGDHSLLLDDASGTGRAQATWSLFATSAGRNHYVSARAFQTGTDQQLRVRWIDASGHTLGFETRTTSGAVEMWQRVSLDLTAPEGARYGELQIASGSDAPGRTWWDDVRVTDSAIPDASLEQSPGDDGSLRSWQTTGSGGASAMRSSDRARLGRWSLLLTDATPKGATSATSERTRVDPGVTYTFRGWVHPVSGTTAVDVLWYDAEGREVGTRTMSGARAAGRWSLVTAADVVAPHDAHFAAVRPRTSVAGTGTASWDAFSLAPTPAAEPLDFSTTDLGTPLRASARTRTSAPFVKDGRVKVATLVTGVPTRLQVLDLETGALEDRVELAGMTTGQTVVVGRDGRLYAGGDGGHLYRWTPGADSAEDLGQVTGGARTVFDLAVAPDGTIWGGSYPGGELWRVDPDSGEITNLGRVRHEQEYARSIAVDDRYVYVGVGTSQPAIVRVAIDDPDDRTVIALPGRATQGVLSELELLGRYLAVKVPAGTNADGSHRPTERRLYDLERRTWDVPVNAADQLPTPLDSRGRFHYVVSRHLVSIDSRTGRSTTGPAATPAIGQRHVVRATIRGRASEWLLVVDPTTGDVVAHDLESGREDTFSLRLRPEALPTKALAEGSNGTALVGGYAGPQVAMVDARSGALRPGLTTGAPPTFGEVEGGTTLGGVNYLGTYTSAHIWRLDPSEGGGDLVEVAALGKSHDQDRPTAWATDGDRVFFGTVPKYGVLGGGIGTIQGGRMTRFTRGVVRDQSVVSLTARDGVVYGGTSRWGGLGATPTTPSARVFGYDPVSGRVTWSVAPAEGAQSLTVTVGPRGTIWAADGGTLYELDPTDGHTLRSITVDPTPVGDSPTFRSTDLVTHRGYLFLRTNGRLYAVDPINLRTATPVSEGVTARGIVRADDRLVVGASDHVLAVDIR